MKSAIVTGGGGGIGRTICQALDAAGYRVGVMDVSNAQATADMLRNAVALVADVRDEAAVEHALHQFGEAPDALVHVAGIVRKSAILDHSVEDFRKVLDVNLVGAFVVGRAVSRRMAARGRGSIVNITSIGAVTPAVLCGSYGPSKAGLANLTQLMAVELAPHGIRVNAVAPGLIGTGMGEIAILDPQIGEKRRSLVPGGQLGRGEDVAGAVLYLISDAAAYVSGTQIVVDGALTVSILRGSPQQPAS